MEDQYKAENKNMAWFCGGIVVGAFIVSAIVFGANLVTYVVMCFS